VGRRSISRGAALVALAACAACAATGCGGPITPDELARSVETLQSAAAEGELLAGHAARDRTKSTFVRVHARELGDVVAHEAEKLNDADADDADVAAAKTAAVDLADRIDQALGQLQTAPGDEAAGRTAAAALARLSEDAGKLADGL
jgi:hypothetical protein